MERLVITGTGRSGTKSSAYLFTKLGIETTHQVTFRGHPPKWGRKPGDSSGLAAPFVKVEPLSTLVIHQVRDPLKVVLSLVHQGHVPEHPWDPGNPKLQLKGNYVYAKFAPEIFQADTLFKRACKLWVIWNKMVEEISDQPNYMRVRLEDYSPEVLASILERFGLPWNDHQQQVWEQHSKTVGASHGTVLDTSDRNCQEYRDLLVLAERYGY